MCKKTSHNKYITELKEELSMPAFAESAACLLYLTQTRMGIIYSTTENRDA